MRRFVSPQRNILIKEIRENYQQELEILLRRKELLTEWYK